MAEETKTIRFTQSAGIDNTVYRAKDVVTLSTSLADAIIAEGNAEEVDPDAESREVGGEAADVAELRSALEGVKGELEAEREAHVETAKQRDGLAASVEFAASGGELSPADLVEIPDELPKGHAELGHLAGTLGLPIRNDENGVLSKADLTAAIEAVRAKRGAEGSTGE